jgi:hypothetical protein
MNSWLERYREGLSAQVWTEMTSLGADLRNEPDTFDAALAVARATMRRARANVELLVDLLPARGYEFAADPFTPPPADIGVQLDQVEAEVGLLPLSLRVWFEEVGQVNFVGSHPDWTYDYFDPLVVEAPPSFILSEHADWTHDRATEWDRGSVFEIGIAPDYLHKADVSGGMPYSLAVPNAAADGLLLWEPHQTTFVNYLRLTFRTAGMPGWERDPSQGDEWGLPNQPPPQFLTEISQQLRPL